MATKAPNPADVLRLGAQTATIKANMPKKRWAKFVKLAHARGHTVAGELSDNPTALKERTASSLRAEAQKTVNTAYAPAVKELSTREKAIGYLDQKRKNDDAAYRTWLTGETDKLNAQARAADATLQTQQSTIADETKTAIAAARADSLQRMAGASSVSNPAQSTALDTSAADTASTQHIAAARDQSAAISKIGEDSRTLASASVLAQQAARESSRQGDTLKALGDLNTDKLKLDSDKAGALLDRTSSLIKDNAAIQQSNREAELASASLGVKRDDIAATIQAANLKYKIESAKFTLDTWKAKNAAKVAQAKIDLGYANIKATKGTAAANRALTKKLEEIRHADRTAALDETTRHNTAAERTAAKNAAKKDKKAGITTAERDLYRGVDTARGLFVRWDKNNAVPLAEREQKLREMGYDDATIAVAHDLARNHGILSAGARVTARKLGIIHSGYFWPPLSTATQPSGDAGH